MYGYNNGLSMVNTLCEKYDFILLQEHWLSSAELNKLNFIHKDFTPFSVSAMDAKISNGILVGRPFGGTAILCRSNLLKFITLIEIDSNSGRFISIRYHTGSIDIIITNVYFPTYKTSVDYTIECSYLIAYIERILTEFSFCKHIIAGDYNFDFADSSSAFGLFKHVIDNYSMICCDNLSGPQSVNYTYCHSSLLHYSWIDHFIVSNDLVNENLAFEIIDNGANLSDHLPISLVLQITTEDLGQPVRNHNSPMQSVLRWDKADLMKYYVNTSSVLQSMSVPTHLLHCNECNCVEHKALINVYYNMIVEALKRADSDCIPKITPKSLKPFWSPSLNKLKQISIDLHNLWRSIGSPTRNSTINAARIKAKYEYKLAIKQARLTSAQDRADEINSSLADRNPSAFWKCWNANYNIGKISENSPIIDNKSDPVEIANTFKDYFSSIYINSSDDQQSVNEYTKLSYTMSACTDSVCSVDIEDIESAIGHLHMNKAADRDGIMSEHIVNSHPSIVVHLKLLFSIMMKHSFVPESFTAGTIIPIVKDKRGDLTSVQNYRPITISPIISKIFEYFLLNKYSFLMPSDDLQFGFKAKTGCPNAIFLLRRVIEHFNDKQSNVYIASLDASKGFDRINHFTLFSTLIKHGLPKCFVNIIVNWYSRLSVNVR